MHQNMKLILLVCLNCVMVLPPTISKPVKQASKRVTLKSAKDTSANSRHRTNHDKSNRITTAKFNTPFHNKLDMLHKNYSSKHEKNYVSTSTCRTRYNEHTAQEEYPEIEPGVSDKDYFSSGSSDYRSEELAESTDEDEYGSSVKYMHSSEYLPKTKPSTKKHAPKSSTESIDGAEISFSSPTSTIYSKTHKKPESTTIEKEYEDLYGENSISKSNAESDLDQTDVAALSATKGNSNSGQPLISTLTKNKPAPIPQSNTKNYQNVLNEYTYEPILKPPVLNLECESSTKNDHTELSTLPDDNIDASNSNENEFEEDSESPTLITPETASENEHILNAVDNTNTNPLEAEEKIENTSAYTSKSIEPYTSEGNQKSVSDFVLEPDANSVINQNLKTNTQDTTVSSFEPYTNGDSKYELDATSRTNEGFKSNENFEHNPQHTPPYESTESTSTSSSTTYTTYGDAQKSVSDFISEPPAGKEVSSNLDLRLDTTAYDLASTNNGNTVAVPDLTSEFIPNQSVEDAGSLVTHFATQPLMNQKVSSNSNHGQNLHQSCENLPESKGEVISPNVEQQTSSLLSHHGQFSPHFENNSQPNLLSGNTHIPELQQSTLEFTTTSALTDIASQTTPKKEFTTQNGLAPETDLAPEDSSREEADSNSQLKIAPPSHTPVFKFGGSTKQTGTTKESNVEENLEITTETITETTSEPTPESEMFFYEDETSSPVLITKTLKQHVPDDKKNSNGKVNNKHFKSGCCTDGELPSVSSKKSTKISSMTQAIGKKTGKL